MNIVKQRAFVPHDLDPAIWQQLEPLYIDLLERQIDSSPELAQWLSHYSELTAVVDEFGSRRYIEHACHTGDVDIERAYLHFVEHIEPKTKPLDFQLKRRFVDLTGGREPQFAGLEAEAGTRPDVPSPDDSKPDTVRFDVLMRHWKAEVDLFRDENVPLQTELNKLNSQYDKLIGAMGVSYNGNQYTLQQLARYQEEPDRQVRQTTWKLANRRRLDDRDVIEAIFVKMLRLRSEIASNAGHANYRQWAWQSQHRFDYTPQDCLDFGQAIEQVCVPAVAKLDEQRYQRLGIEKLRPWDTAVDPLGRSPLRPFADDDVRALVDGCRSIFQRIGGPDLAAEFATLEFGENLDLDSRPGKRAGGFQASLAESGQPFIFMNAAGLQRDVETLLHEGGHAFHFLWSLHEPLVFLRQAPIEFCEVASMAMELLAADKLDVFYVDTAQQHRAQRKFYEGIVRFFPWMAIIDGYQHWLYTHPDHSADQRLQAWLELLEKFQSGVVNWAGYEEVRASLWQRLGHLFHVPFYYVEYGIAQLGALQLWLQYRDDPERALSHYRAALALGGTRPLPQLFAAAGIRFDFSRQTLEPLIAAVGSELDRLPD